MSVPPTAIPSYEPLILYVSREPKLGDKECRLSYDPYLCCGEVIRNICVNLGIDPDTVDGVTRNISIQCNNAAWTYNPHDSLLKAGVSSGDYFTFEMI